MKKAAIVTDTWKLPTFKKILDHLEYDYTCSSFTDGTTLINVMTPTLDEMVPIVYQANSEAKKSKMN